MPRRYPGGRISKTAPTPTGPFQTGTAPGIWSLEEQAQFVKQGIWPTAGLAPPFIEDVFSCFLYTGNNSTQTITNGIDLSGKGGLVWYKSRSSGTWNHGLFDTTRGITKQLFSNTTSAEGTYSGVTAFNTNGFSIGSDNGGNESGGTIVSWTFRKQPKFFDVVTYTGTGSVQNIPHNLGSVPGCIIIKNYTSGGGENWNVYHRSLGNTARAFLDLTSAAQTGITAVWNSTTPTDTVFTVGTNNQVNTNGASNVAYLFAHDAGGFGLTGTDNVISCGSYTGTGTTVGPTVNLGYEPQWLMVKASSSDPGYPSNRWTIIDNMRGWPSGPNANSQWLMANTSDSEQSGGGQVANMTSTGFTVGAERNDSGVTFIYIAIRRGPMKVPTLGTSVYNAIARTGTGATATITAGFPYDWLIAGIRNLAYGSKNWDRLRGITNPLLNTTSTNAEYTGSSNSITAGTQNGLTVGADSDLTINYSSANYINWFFRRSPSVFDIVCYTGTGNNPLILNHNLGKAAEVIIIKRRSSAASNNNWYCGWNMQDVNGSNQPIYMEVLLNSDANGVEYIYPNWFVSAPSATTFTLNGGGNVNQTSATYVAYLFATCPNVSKVGKYIGTGALQTINCGFTTGARFVLIKRTDSPAIGNWWVYDSTRGITSGNDPYYLLNLNDAEVTGTNYVDTDSTGFKVTAAAPAGLNANGGSFIFLAVA